MECGCEFGTVIAIAAEDPRLILHLHADHRPIRCILFADGAHQGHKGTLVRGAVLFAL